jgi:hypothetical protein
MSQITGTPIGNLDVQEGLYVDSAPYIYFQDYNATPLFNPDADGFYWGMSGTTAYPAYEIGCPADVTFSEDVTMNETTCDTVGVVSTTQQRNYLTMQFTVKTLFPLQTLRLLLKGGAVTETAPTQKFGFGPINNNQFWMVYCPRVYDTDVGDYTWLHFHKCQFVDAWSISMAYGTAWNVTNISLRAFADTTKPSAQQFGIWGRSDASVIT